MSSQNTTKPKTFLRRVLEVYQPFKKSIYILLGFFVVTQALALTSPYLFGKIINQIYTHGSFSSLAYLAVATFLVQLLLMGINYWKDIYEIRFIDFRVNKYVSTKTLGKILSLSVGQHKNQNSGMTQTVINKGEASLTQLAYSTVYQILPTAAQVIITILVLMYLSFTLGLIVLVGTILFISWSVYINKKFKNELKSVKTLNRKNDSLHAEILRNLSVVQINAQENKVTDDYILGASEYTTLGEKVWDRFMSWSLLRTVFNILIRFSVLIVGAYYVYKGYFQPGYLVTVMMWTTNVVSNLQIFANMHRQIMDQSESVNKYFSLLDIQPAVQISSHPIQPKSFAGQVEFRNVSFAYPTESYIPKDKKNEKVTEKKENPQTLRDVSFVIEPGKKVAFVGPSGAGKSTIINLIVRGYDPEKGSILIDNNDLRELDLDLYRRSIGLVEQHVGLFDNTLRYNILFGLPSDAQKVSDEELDQVAKAACIDRFYDRLTEGFETEIGENGIQLSGGERQRVGIARALIKNPAILIFDEATSSLDAVNEALIKESIAVASKGRTTIIIAHRLSTVKDADKIFVVDNGVIAEEGTHEELLEKSALYKELVKTQMFS